MHTTAVSFWQETFYGSMTGMVLYGFIIVMGALETCLKAFPIAKNREYKRGLVLRVEKGL